VRHRAAGAGASRSVVLSGEPPFGPPPGSGTLERGAATRPVARGGTPGGVGNPNGRARVDLTAVCGVILHSTWLLPVLALMIVVDGPLPMLPSETVLLTALAVAFAEHDVTMLAGLFLVSVLGSMGGDLAVFGLGRSSRRIVRAAESENRLTHWVRCNVLCRPGVTMVGARFVPAGRLVSTAAAGRFGLPVRTFVPWSLAGSVAWALYMALVAAVINPIADGRPVSALLAGIGAGILTAVFFAGVKAIQDRRRVAPALATLGPLSLAGRRRDI
jgi:membrane protein DedA with SNARE-associated domain